VSSVPSIPHHGRSQSESRPSICLAGTHYHGEKPGGVESQVAHIGAILRNAGWRVTFLCPSLAGKEGPEVTEQGDTVLWFRQPSYGFQLSDATIVDLLDQAAPSAIYHRGRSLLQESGILLRYSASHGVPLVFALSSDSDLVRFSASVEMLRSPRPLWKRLALLPYALWSDARMRRTLRRASHIVVQHSGQKVGVHDVVGRSAQLLRTLHPELDRPVRKGPRLKVSWISNYRPLKQGELFVRLAERCRDIDCDFVIVTGRTKPEYVEPLQTASAGLTNLVVLDQIPPREAERLLEESALFVNTSLYEGFPNTFVQGWLRETPTVSLHVDPDQVLAREGIGVCSGDFERLVADVRRLLLDADERIEMGRRARRYAESEHGISNNEMKLTRFFAGVGERSHISSDRYE